MKLGCDEILDNLQPSLRDSFVSESSRHNRADVLWTFRSTILEPARNLRQALEKQGFVVNATERWHFEYKDWKQYPTLNTKFEDL